MRKNAAPKPRAKRIVRPARMITRYLECRPCGYRDKISAPSLEPWAGAKCPRCGERMRVYSH